MIMRFVLRPAPPRSRPGTLLAIAVALGGLVLAGCGDERQPLFNTTPEHQGETERKTILAEIAQLSNAKTEVSDAQASKLYDEAKAELIARGSSIENDLCEALVSNQDWGVRLGCVEVLESIGTKVCVPTVIVALDDPEAVVALYANHMLVALCKHDEVPAADAKPGANGLPPLPPKSGHETTIDADMKRWSAWYEVNHATLHKAWDTWWAQNKDRVKID
jgi:outer membrane murein-binding lipoprotein Lpp